MRLTALLLTTFLFLLTHHIVFAEDSPIPATAETQPLTQPENKEQQAATPLPQPAPTESEKKDNVKKVKLHHGKVSTIHNSVSFSVKDDAGKEHVLRLAEINTPYLDKPHGPESLKAIKELIDNKNITYQIVSSDSTNKKVVKAFIDDINVNAWMIKNGHAWMSKKFGHDPELIDLQDKAKAGRIGLWANGKAGFGSKGMKRRTHKHQS